MTKDQIIAMAGEAGMNLDSSYSIYVGSEINLERFASLVAAQAAAEEREECAMAVEKVGPKEGPLKLVTEGFAKAIRERKSP